jgi:hypothetical protein
MEIKRRKFQGVLNILSFNRRFYVFGLIVLSLIVASHVLFEWPNLLFWIIIAAFLYGLIMPLIVSAYVYDYSGYYNFKWLENENLGIEGPKQILNINAGFDETSFIRFLRFKTAYRAGNYQGKKSEYGLSWYPTNPIKLNSYKR